MKFSDTPIHGAFLVEIPRFPDERGYLDVLYSSKWLEDRGVPLRVAQSMSSWNKERGTLRGLHYQEKPRMEIKLVSCVVGAVFDVIVDIRPDSPTYKQWYGVELTAENHRGLYVPEGLAHGYQTLVDNSLFLYHTTQPYEPSLARGVAWNDPAFGVKWPEVPRRIISARDQEHRPFVG